MLTYSSVHGHAFIDRELYLPAEWTSDPARLAQAGVPDDRKFATKPQLAVAELERAVQAGVPFAAMVADSGYGRDPGLRAWCHEHSVAYAVGVPVDLPLVGPAGKATRPDRVHRTLPAGIWERRTLGAGSKGERFYDWACVGVQVRDQSPATGFDHSLVIRKSREPVRGKNGKLAFEFAYFLVYAPAGTTMSTIMRWLGLRWSVEEDNKQGKDVFGLDGYQVRKWVSWYRHVTCSMLAHAFTAVKRAELGKEQGRGGGTVTH